MLCRVRSSSRETRCYDGVQNRLPEVVDRLQREHGCVVITKHGHPAAMVISPDDLKKLDVMDSATEIIV
jgi:prevent-host-death family protein